MTSAPTNVIDIKVNRAEAVRDLQAINRQFRQMAQSAGALGGAGASAAALAAAVQQSARAATQNTAALRAMAAATQQAAAAAAASASAAAASAAAMANQGAAAAAATSKMAGFAAAANGIASAVMLAAGAATYGFMRMSDSFNMARSKIALTAAGADEFTKSWAAVQAIAIETSTDVASTATLFGKMREAFGSTANAAELSATATQTFGKMLKISGTDANGAAAAILQFSQALSAGYMMGEELNTILEQSPVYAEALAKTMGVAKGELKGMAAEGLITSEVMKKALTDPAMIAEIEKKFAAIPATFGDMMQNTKTVAIVGMGEIGRALMGGLSLKDIDFGKFLEDIKPKLHDFGFALRDVGSTFVGVFQGIGTVVGPVFTMLGNNLDLVGYSLAYLVASSVALKAANIAAPLVSLAGGALSAAGAVAKFVTSGTMLAQTTAGIGALTTAIKGSTVAQIAMNVAAMANPYVLLAAGAVAAVGAVAYFTSEMKVSENGLATWGDVASTVMSDVGSVFSGAGDWFNGIGESASKNFGEAKKSVSDFVSNIDIDAATIGTAFVASTGVAGAAIGGLAMAAGVTGSDISNIASSVSDHWGRSFEGAGDRTIAAMGKSEAATYQSFASVGRAIDIVAKLASAGFVFVTTSIKNAIKAVANGVIIVINTASQLVTNIANMAIVGINKLIEGANALGASFSAIKPVDLTVKIAKFDYDDASAEMAAAVSGKSIGAEALFGSAGAWLGRGGDAINSYRDNVLSRSETAAQRAAKAEAERRKLADDPTTNGGGGDDKTKPAGDTTGDKGKGKGKDSAQDQANRAAEEAAKLKENLDGFWKSFEQSTEAAKLVGIELENHNALLKIQDIYGEKWKALQADELADITARIDGANRLLATNKAVTDLNQKSADFATQIATETQRGTLIAQHGSAIGQKMFEQEKARAELKAKALADGVDLTSKEYLAAQRVADERQRELDIIEKRNASLGRASDYVADAVAKADPKAAARDNYQKTMADLEEWRRVILENTAEGSKERLEADRRFKIAVGQAGEDFQQQVWDAGQQLRDDFSTLAGAFGDIFGAKIGAAVDGLGQVVSGLQSGGFASGAMGANSSSPVARALTSMKSIGEAFKVGGSITKALGQMSSGAAIGSAIAPIGKLISKKFSTTGSQIGGAIGSIGGPIGSVVGSILGGVVGGLFKKTKWGTAVLTGNSSAATVSGRGAAQKSNATGAAASVQDALSQLASELGGDVGSYKVSIGQYKGKWRVHEGGYGGKLKGKTGAVDFGKDGAEAALRFAIEDAIKDGAITNIAPILQKGLKKLTLEAAVQFAKDWKAVEQGWAAVIDPIGAGVKALIEPFDTLRKTMISVGATVEEMTTLEKYRAHTVDEYFKEQMSTLKDFRKTLFGDNMGVTKMSQFNAASSAYSALQAKVAAGEKVDDTAFTNAASEFLSKAADVYGTSNQSYQAMRNQVIQDTDGRISEIEKQRLQYASTEAQRQTEIAQAQLLQQEIANNLTRENTEMQKNMWTKLAELLTKIQAGGGGVNGVANALRV